MGRKTMRPTMKLWCAAVVATILALPVQAQAQTQDYPNKPITFITPAAAGNSPDVVTPEQMRDRVAKELAMWKQVVKDGNIPQQ